MLRPIAAAITLALAATVVPAHAQQFLGRVGSGCTILPANNTQGVPLDAAVPAGTTLVISVAASSKFVSDLTISDPNGSVYQALGGNQSGNAGMLVHFRTLLQRPLGAGATVQLKYANAGSGVQSCASVLGFRGIPAGSIVQDALGAAAGNSATPAVNATASSTAQQEWVLASFSTAATPGNVGAQAPATALVTVCSADISLCLLDAFYVTSTVGTPGVSLTLANAVNWTGALTALYADGIFGNGFD
ncbi:MAG: hypothetical protein ABI748_03190 [Dokdonella sp.]